jgi:perosamine synthetase
MTYASTGNFKTPINETLKTLHSAGINKIELSGGIYNRNLIKILKQYKNIFFSIHNYFPAPKKSIVLNLASLNKGINNTTLDFMINSIKLVKRLGLKTYSFHAGFRIDPNTNELGKKINSALIIQEKEACMKKFIENVNLLYEIANKLDIRLLIENNVCSKANSISFKENPFLMCDLEDTNRIMNELNGKAGLLLDVGHLKVSSNILGFSKERFMNNTKNWTEGYHLSENDSESDLNLPINNESWFWHHIKSDIKYRVVEIYENNPVLLREQIDLTDKNFEKYKVNKNKYIPIQEPLLGKEELSNAISCIKSGWISSQGSYVKKFESAFSKIHNNMYTLAVSNGTAALHLSLLALGVKEGDEVIVPDLTFAAVINSVINTNATPVICEIEKESFCICFKSLKKLITKKTKAIIAVHLYGYPIDLKEISRYCKQKKIFIIEDCAEALGSKYYNKPVGTTFCDSSTFSFFGNKTITTGEGGMVMFKNKKYFEKAMLLRDHGMSKNKKYYHTLVGYNYRLTSIQAAIGVAQITKFSMLTKKKDNIIKWYKHYLKDCEHIYFQPEVRNSFFNSNWLIVVKVNNKKYKKKLIAYLHKKNIEARQIFYPLSTLPIYKKYFKSSNKKSIEAYNEFICLPSSVKLKKDQIDYISRTIKKFFS